MTGNALTKSGQSICRWGILGAAAIARKNWKAIRLSGNGTITAVASRSIERAQQFIDDCDAEISQIGDVAAVGSYEELLSRDDVDAVYIPLPTGVRKSWVLKAAAAGKHVLCEKPVALNADDMRDMIEACQTAGVQFMDGVMFDHGERIEQLRRSVVDEGAIGRVRRINTHFSFFGGDDFESGNIRAAGDLEPHGCLGDLGWYCIRFTLWMTGGELPTSLTARLLTPIGGDVDSRGETAGGVPGEFSAELDFAGGLSASFYCTFLSSNQQTALVSGEEGYISLDDFVLPMYRGRTRWQRHQHDLQIHNCRWNFVPKTECHHCDEFPSGEPDSQEVNMVRNFAAIAVSGRVDPKYAEISLGTQRVLDACRLSAAGGGTRVEVK